MWTIKLKAQPTKLFFATVNQMFGSSSQLFCCLNCGEQFHYRTLFSHHTHFRESDDLPLLQGPAVKKKPPFFNARALITLEIMYSTDTQYITGE